MKSNGKKILLGALSAVGMSSLAIFMGYVSESNAEASCARCETGSKIGTAPSCIRNNSPGYGPQYCKYTVGSGSPPMIYCDVGGFTGCEC